MSKINTPSGFRDLLPKEARERDFLIRTIIGVYQKFGFYPLETPVAEFQEGIAGDKADDFNLFFLESNKDSKSDAKEEIALRFDLTVPLARVIGQYGDKLPRPFKRYQLGDVFRGERPQRGRYRQFVQLDADVVGSKKIQTDVEMLLMIHEIMSSFMSDGFVIRVSSRKLINLLPKFLSFDDSLLEKIVVLVDKSEKISQEDFRKELENFNLTETQNNSIIEFASISKSPETIMDALQSFFKDSEIAQDIISEIDMLARGCVDLGISSHVSFDMNIVRGFGYYTGTVFETNIRGPQNIGSVVSGGRYDALTGRFSNELLPSIGVSAGVDRLHTVLSEMGIFSELLQTRKIVVFYRENFFASYALDVAQSLRQNISDIEVDVYAGNKDDFKDIFKYCELVEATHLCIIDKREFDAQSVTIKNLATREQNVCSLKQMLDIFNT